MNSPNCLELKLQFAKAPFNLRMGFQDYYGRNNWTAHRHCNADYEVHIVLSGKCVLEVGAQDTPLAAAQAILITPGTFHYPHDLSADFERLSFSFMPIQQEFAQQLFSQIQSAVVCDLPPEGVAICRLIFAELSETQPFSDDSIHALFTQLLVVLFRKYHLEFSEHTAQSDTTARRTSIIDHFFSPWPDPFGTEDELAAMLNLSRRQLNRVLIQYYGMGFRQKMLQARMEYAGNFLQTTNMKVGQIAVLVGYTAESSFYKAFQNYYNMTPQQYRDARKGKNGE